MKKPLLLSLSLFLLLSALSPVWGQMHGNDPNFGRNNPGFGRNNPNLGREIDTINDSITVINEVMRIPAKSIPTAMFAKAEGLVIVPSMVKGGFGIGGAHGRGVFLTRRPDRSWEPPVFITMTNGSFGFQIGLQAIDVVLIFNTRRSVESFKNGKFTLGVDAAATAGPVGRQATLGTDITLKSEIFSYSRTRGLFVGAAIDGGVMNLDNAVTSLYYNSQPGGALPQGAALLMETVTRYSGAPTPSFRPVTAVGGQPASGGWTPNQPGMSDPNQDAYPIQNPGQNQSPYQDSTIPPINNAGAYSGEQGAMQGMPGSATSAASAAARKQLADAFTQLGPMLDPQWQTYLALPTEIFAAPNVPDPPLEVIQDVLNHYRAVNENNQYQALTSRQEFRNVYQLLGHYQKLLQQK